MPNVQNDTQNTKMPNVNHAANHEIVRGTCVKTMNAKSIAPMLPPAPTIPATGPIAFGCTKGTIANVAPSAACTHKLNIINITIVYGKELIHVGCAPKANKIKNTDSTNKIINSEYTRPCNDSEEKRDTTSAIIPPIERANKLHKEKRKIMNHEIDC
eukprot:523757_1